jgi:hypothetical protein
LGSSREGARRSSSRRILPRAGRGEGQAGEEEAEGEAVSVNTDAILCYGVQVQSETIEEFSEGETEEEFEQAKAANPLGFLAWSGDKEEHLGVGVSLIGHQSNSYPEYMVAVSASAVRAWRGNPKRIVSVLAGPAWADAIEAFCKKHNVKTAGAIGWWMASHWGA